MLPFDSLLRSKGLALPIGTHFLATLTQGMPFGFDVGGRDAPSVLRPSFNISTDWLTSSDFGIEASLIGLVAISALLIGLYIWNPKGEAAS